jgi:hypothetical protein
VATEPQAGLSNEYDVRFLLAWLLGVPGLVVLTWAMIAG